MRRYSLLLILALPVAGILPPPLHDRTAAQSTTDAAQPADEPALRPTPDKVRLSLNPGGHTASVTRVFFTPDSKQVITLSLDHTIRIWDALTGETLKVLYPPGLGGLRTGALSSDGKTLAVGSRYPEGSKILHVIYLLALPDGHVKRVLKGHTAPIEALAFSADGKRLASAAEGKDGAIRLWSPARDEPEKVFRFKGVPFVTFKPRGRLAFSPDGKRLVRIRTFGHRGDIIDLATGKVVASIKGQAVAWSPDGKTLATAMEGEGGIVLWNPDGSQRRQLLDNKTEGRAVAFSADSRTVLGTWGSPAETGIFDVATSKVLVKAKVTRVGGGVLSPDGKLAAMTSNTRNGSHGITVWKTTDGTVVQRVWPAPWLVKGRDNAGWRADGKAVTWSRRTNKRTFNLDQLQFGPALAAKDFRGAVSRQGALSLKGSKVIKNGVVLANLRGAAPTLVGTDRAAAHNRTVIYLYEAATGKVLRRFRGHLDGVYNLAPSPDGRFLLSTSQDQTLKIWSVAQEKPLLSFFVQGNDWIAWTEEGYFAATPGGERLLGWKVDNGIDQAASFYPAERFRKQLYRPDVIRLVLAKGSVAEALKEADALARRSTRPVEVEQLLPPRVVLEVVDRTALPEVKLRVVATARGKSQLVTALRLLVDGRPVPGKNGFAEFGKGKERAEKTFTIKLPGEKASGPYHLAVLAHAPDSSSLSEVVEVPYLNPKKLPVMHVLAIGINQYKDPYLKLNVAVADARAICKTFVERSKGELFRDVLGKTLLDGQANRTALLGELDGLRQKVKANDLVVVFFAGHGVKTRSGSYLLTAEADTTNDNTLARTALSGVELQKRLGGLPCQVLLLLDACHPGAFDNRKDFRPATDDLTRSLTGDEVGVAVMGAAMGHEKPEEKKNKGHGLFTWALREALTRTEQVHYNYRDHRQYLHHLHAFVLDEVKALSEDRQHPFLSLPLTVESFALRQLPRLSSR